MTLTSWPARRWIVAVMGAAAFALLAGLPTDVVPNPAFARMTPVLWWNYPVLAATAVLGGLVAATYVRTPANAGGLGRAAGGGVLSALAIGCPACNKLVVLLLGFSGALTVWAPIQPIVAVASVAILGFALKTRLAAERACPLPSQQASRNAADAEAPQL